MSDGSRNPPDDSPTRTPRRVRILARGERGSKGTAIALIDEGDGNGEQVKTVRLRPKKDA